MKVNIKQIIKEEVRKELLTEAKKIKDLDELITVGQNTFKSAKKIQPKMEKILENYIGAYKSKLKDGSGKMIHIEYKYKVNIKQIIHAQEMADKLGQLSDEYIKVSNSGLVTTLVSTY